MTRLGIAAEDRSDVRLLTGLVDAIVVAEVDWIEPEVLDAYRSWCGPEGDDWLDLHQATDRARQRRFRGFYGRFGGEPGALDAHMFRAVFLLFAEEDEPPAAVIVGRDTDGHTERRHGFEQAAARDWPFITVLALADPESEAWRIATWTPDDDDDRRAQLAERERLGFDPILAPHRLTSGRSTNKRDCKKVLENLCAHGRSAADRWETLDKSQLSGIGPTCGLARFVEDVFAVLVPVVGGR
ncbi:MAG: hypothetical protein H6738_17475 [Alphaproteobacteria bacterium]|nr:hypothetical protein [Alphaproteobacteria bacterium]MCB9698575.1 hypothetical protein [Alphaproteobacteria bacterium]